MHFISILRHTYWDSTPPLIDRLFWFDPQHCAEAFRSEVERRQLPKGYDKTA